MIIVWLLLVVLFSWRITSLIARERGPFAIGTRLRSAFGVYHEPDGTPSEEADGELRLNPVTPSARVDAFLHEIAHGMTCVWCCSVWVCMGSALLLRNVSPVVFDATSYVLVVGGLSAGVIVVQAVVDRLNYRPPPSEEA